MTGSKGLDGIPSGVLARRWGVPQCGVFRTLPSTLDAALLRPGRIDRQYKVGYPSKAGRKRTFEGYLSRVNHQLSDEDIDRLATISPYATGASIKDVTHDRAFAGADVSTVNVFCTIETRDHAHVREVHRLLRKSGVRICRKSH